jgi:hypothetical protein
MPTTPPNGSAEPEITDFARHGVSGVSPGMLKLSRDGTSRDSVSYNYAL